MLPRKQIQHLVAAIALIISCNLSAKPIKCFVPSKPWSITIDLNDFEPWDLLGQNTILGGRTNDGVNITIIIETTKPGATPAEMRKLYGYRYANGSGQKQTIEEINFNDIAVITYKWIKPDLPDANEAVQNRAKELTQNMWGFNGYVVKDDIAFDIHLSADMGKLTKNQMLDVIKSFKVTPSSEQEELLKLRKSIASSSITQDMVKRVSDFALKYPQNPIAQYMLGEHYLVEKNYPRAKLAYLKALSNHKIQPMNDLHALLLCYDGLGMSCGIQKEYGLSEKYLKTGYELAKKIKDEDFIRILAYNLACLYAEIRKIDESISFLSEAAKINPEIKEQAKTDSSFDSIRDDSRFKNFIEK